MAAEGPLVARPDSIPAAHRTTSLSSKEPQSEQHVHWGAVNKPIEEAKFDLVHRDMMAYAQDKELFVLDAWGEPIRSFSACRFAS